MAHVYTRGAQSVELFDFYFVSFLTFTLFSYFWLKERSFVINETFVKLKVEVVAEQNDNWVIQCNERHRNFDIIIRGRGAEVSENEGNSLQIK